MNSGGEASGRAYEGLSVVDAELTSRDTTLAKVETLTLQLVEALALGVDPTLFLVCIPINS